ncbi:RDD family protein [Roseibacillus persicicus]|uniref:RDD family protein n=1 Tax=Roseibacillus persicicus TaxID=454148 RepID=UPI001E59FFE5|nr:hypothetical protein [Roseibacillus persicicus]
MNRNRFSAVATISVPTLGIKDKTLQKGEKYEHVIEAAERSPAGEPMGAIEVSITPEMAGRIQKQFPVEVQEVGDAQDSCEPLSKAEEIVSTYADQWTVCVLEEDEISQEEEDDTLSDIDALLEAIEAILDEEENEESSILTAEISLLKDLVAKCYQPQVPLLMDRGPEAQAEPRKQPKLFPTTQSANPFLKVCENLTATPPTAPLLLMDRGLPAPEEATVQGDDSPVLSPAAPLAKRPEAVSQPRPFAELLRRKALPSPAKADEPKEEAPAQAPESPATDPKEFPANQRPSIPLPTDRMVATLDGALEAKLVNHPCQPEAPVPKPSEVTKTISPTEAPALEKKVQTPKIAEAIAKAPPAPILPFEKAIQFADLTEEPREKAPAPESTPTAQDPIEVLAETLPTAPVATETADQAADEIQTVSVKVPASDSTERPSESSQVPDKELDAKAKPLEKKVQAPKTAEAIAKAPPISVLSPTRPAHPPTKAEEPRKEIPSPEPETITQEPSKVVTETLPPKSLATDQNVQAAKTAEAAEAGVETPTPHPSLSAKKAKAPDKIEALSEGPSPLESPTPASPPTNPPSQVSSPGALSSDRGDEAKEVAGEIAPSEENTPSPTSPLLRARTIAATIDLLFAISICALANLLLPNSLHLLSFLLGASYLLTKDSLGILNGRSIGKRFMKLRAETRNHRPLTGDYRSSLRRNLSFLIAPIEFAILYVREDEPTRGLRLGDDWARTQVVPFEKPLPRKTKWLP